MAQKDRVFEILELIRTKQKISVSELTQKYKVTNETIRRDLERLEKEGYIARTYGGAVLVQHPTGHVNYSERAGQNVDAKMEIGKIAASILPETGAIGCDASTTVHALIPYIKSRSGLTLLTNSVRILNDYMFDKIRIISTGGVLSSRTHSLQGETTLQVLNNYYPDICVLSCRSLDLQNGNLTITARKGVEKKEEDKEGKMLRQERYAGTLSRSFYVGDAVTEEDIKARYEDGVLTLAIPKKDPAKVNEKKTILIEG